MRIAVDTSLVVRNANRDDALHAHVSTRMGDLVTAGAELCIAPQVVFEFWVVATRPAEVNGLGMSAATAKEKVEAILEGFVLLADPEDLLVRWLALCVRYDVCGKPAHDARLAAWILSQGIDRLLTLNPKDLDRYEGIETVNL